MRTWIRLTMDPRSPPRTRNRFRVLLTYVSVAVAALASPSPTMSVLCCSSSPRRVLIPRYAWRGGEYEEMVKVEVMRKWRFRFHSSPYSILNLFLFHLLLLLHLLLFHLLFLLLRRNFRRLCMKSYPTLLLARASSIMRWLWSTEQENAGGAELPVLSHRFLQGQEYLFLRCSSSCIFPFLLFPFFSFSFSSSYFSYPPPLPSLVPPLPLPSPPSSLLLFIFLLSLRLTILLPH